MATYRLNDGRVYRDVDENPRQLVSGGAGEGRGTTGSQFTFHFADGRDVTGGWDPELGAGTRVADMGKVQNPQGRSSGTVGQGGLSSAGYAKYTADNGMTYTSGNPLGPEEIINRYTGTINSEPEHQESDRTKAAYDRLRGYDDTRPQYTQSDTVTAALDRLRAAEEARPGAYDNRYQADIDAILDSLRNREGFSYDPGEDKLYKTYRDQYLRLGQRAMQDSMGNAAALSGGYGNSYAQRAGQQAYQDYLAGMNDALQGMYGQAYQEWRDQGTDLYDRLNTLRALENEDYARYRDLLGDYLTERNYANTQYAAERDMDYDRYRDTVGDWQTDRGYWAGLYDMERQNDLTEYANRLAQWQADREYWDGLVNNLIAYNGLGAGAIYPEEMAPQINVTVSPQDSWAQYYAATQHAATPANGVKKKEEYPYGFMTREQLDALKTPKPAANMIGTGMTEAQIQALAKAAGWKAPAGSTNPYYTDRGTWSDSKATQYAADYLSGQQNRQTQPTAAQAAQAYINALMDTADKYKVR